MDTLLHAPKERLHRPPPAWKPAAAPSADSNAALRELCRGFQPTGGMASGDDLALLMGRSSPQPISQLARWIVAREVLCVEWQTQTLLPLFQFSCGLHGLRPGMAAALRELVDVFDAWELALWFARGNRALGGASPADTLARDGTAVWQAARTDRFIAAGL